MANLFKILYVVLFVVATLLILALKPEVHKPVYVESQDFKLEEITSFQTSSVLKPTSAVSVSSVNTAENSEPKIYSIAPKDISSSSDNWIFQQGKTQNNVKNVKVEIPQTGTTTKTIVVNQPKSNNTKSKTLTQIMEENEKNPERDLSLDEIDTIIKSLTGQTTGQPQNQTTKKQDVVTLPQNSQNVKSQPKNPYMTEQEEIIAWNKWRANFQNTVMTNSGNIPAPYGTAFLYSCVVDKWGNISNINTWSSNPSFTPMSKQYVKTAITKMQRTPILNFPKGSNRTTVVVEGSFIMSNVDRFATPDYYSDYERVKVTR